MKLAAILDKQQAFIDFERNRILKEWGVELSATRKVEKLEEVGVSSLFGDAPLAILAIDDNSTAKTIAEKLGKIDEALKTRLGNPGLIITVTADRTSTRTLEKLIKELGGEVIISKGEGKETSAAKLLDKLALNRETRAFVEDYAGDNYSSILGLVAALESLPVKHQKLVSIEDVLIRLPTPPGSIPPWELESTLFAGNVSRTIEVFRRVSSNSSPLMPLAFIKNKFILFYRIASLVAENPRITTAGIADKLSPKVPAGSTDKELKKAYDKAAVKDNYPLKLALGKAKSVGYVKLQRIVELIASKEAKVKSGTSGDPMIALEAMLIEITAILR